MQRRFTTCIGSSDENIGDVADVRSFTGASERRCGAVPSTGQWLPSKNSERRHMVRPAGWVGKDEVSWFGFDVPATFVQLVMVVAANRDQVR